MRIIYQHLLMKQTMRTLALASMSAAASLGLTSAVGCAPRTPPRERLVAHLAPMNLPNEQHQETFRASILRAHARVEQFAAMHGWQNYAQGSFYDRIEIFSFQTDLWRRVLELNKMPLDTKLQMTGLAAGIEAGVLVAITPEEYARIRPDYAAGPDAWSRLVAHELVHRLHVRLLNGKEEAMGPTWFYEGFAAVGADQFPSGDLKFASTSEALHEATHARPEGAYRYYAAAVRYFAKCVPLTILVQEAGRADFESWLLDHCPRQITHTDQDAH